MAVNRSPNGRLIPEQAGPQELRGGSGFCRSPRVRLSPPPFQPGKRKKNQGVQRKTGERKIERAGFLRFKLRLTQEEPPAIDEKAVSPCPLPKIEFHS